MDAAPDPHAVSSLDALGALYPAPSALVVNKVGTRLDAATRRFVAASPYAVLGTTGPEGPHVTPRGDAPGFLHTPDEHTVLLPDRRGNNRLDALRDILHDPRVTLLVLVPGATDALRIFGTARITTDPALRAALAADGKEPVTVLRIRVASLYMQCGKAAIRAGLWQGAKRPDGVPTLGQLVAAHTPGGIDAEALDAQMPAIYRERLY